MLYSASTGGFYDIEIHGTNIPSDAVEITDDEHAALLTGQAEGKLISADASGHPVLTTPPAPAPAYPRFTALEVLNLFTDPEQLAVVQATMSVAAVKLWYDRMIAATFVTYEDPRTEDGLEALVTAGLITADRKAAIVAAMQPTA